MVRPILRARATILAAFLGALLAPASQAADMLGLPEAPLLPDDPVEWGSNWYLRGDLGWQQANVPAISGNFAAAINDENLLSGGIGGGYQFNDWLRADVTIDRSVFRRRGVIGQTWCPYKMYGLIDQVSGHNVGVLGNPADTCSEYGDASLNRTSFLANAYLDMGHFWGFTPYVGAGFGLTYNSTSTSVAYLRNSDGALWAPDLTLPDGQVPQWIYVDGAPFPIQLPFGPTNWNASQTKKSWQFAWNLMAGVSYDITQNFKVDLGYRYLNAGKYTGLAAWGSNAVPVARDITSHEVRVGFRIMTN